MRPGRLLLAAGLAVMLGALDLQIGQSGLTVHLLGGPAEAKVGHPATPMSYAGVARRSARPNVTRTAVSYDTLPPNCNYGEYFGGKFYNCQGIFYERSAGQYFMVVPK